MPRSSTTAAAGNELALQHGARSSRIVQMYSPRVGAKLRRIAQEDPVELYVGILADVTVQSGLTSAQLKRGGMRGPREQSTRAAHQKYIDQRIALVDRIVAARQQRESDPQAIVARIRAGVTE
jgi:hypothetical protein